ncbi:MAG: alcohol dehydrogenase catalytic domain-containing protein [Anaerolineae bacterium]|nr:alcohol dehydrogenase catalytic domain-containing protein [Anaerolineae bacterium]
MSAIPKSMKAVVLQEPGRLTVEELPVPEIRPHEILLKVGACAMCGSDLEAYWGIHPSVKRYPVVLGHEFAGTVVAAGPKVTRYKVGDRICHTGGRVCGACAACQRGDYKACPERKGAGFATNGAYAEYVALLGDDFYSYPLPDKLSMAQGALAQPFGIGYHAATGKAKAQAGETVVVQGCGPIGLSAMMAAKLSGATLISTDKLDYRLDLAKRLGADYTVNVTRQDAVAFTRELTGGTGVDTVIECVGGDQDETLPQACEMLRKEGRLVVAGSFARDAATIRIITFKFGQMEMFGSQGFPRGYGPLLDLVGSGRIDVLPLMTHRVELDEVPAAMKMLEDKRDNVVKVVIEP